MLDENAQKLAAFDDLAEEVRRLRADLAKAEAERDAAMEDAERWHLVPAFEEEYQINLVKLFRDIDATRIADKEKA